MSGIHVVHEPGAPVVEVRVVGPTAVRDGRDRAELDILAAALTTRGHRHPAGTVTERIDTFATPLAVSVHAGGLVVAGRALQRDADRLFAALDDLFTPGGYDDRVLRPVLSLVLARYRSNPPDPVADRHRTLLHHLHGAAPWWAGAPDDATVRSVDPAAVERRHVATFLSAATEVVVIGDVTEEDVRSRMPRWSLFSCAGASDARPLTDSRRLGIAAPALRAPVAVPAPPGESGVTGIAPGCALDDPQRPALHLANLLVGGGPQALLFRRLRLEKALVYQVRSELSSFAFGGWLTIDTTGRAELQETIVAEIAETLDKFVTAGPTAAEIAGAREHAVGMTTLGVVTRSDRATALAGFRLARLPHDWLLEQGDRLRRTTDDEVVTVLRERFAPDRWSWAISGATGGSTSEAPLPIQGVCA